MTVEPVEAILSQAQFKALGTAAASKTPLSAFHAVAESPTASLPVEMLLDDGRALQPRWWSVSEVLAQADRSGAVTYLGPEGTMQAAVYGRAGPDPAVMVRNVGDRVIIHSPPLVGETIWLMRELVGSSAIGNGAFELELPIDEARTLFAVLDGARRHSLRVMAGDRPEGPTIADFAEVMTATTADDPSMWLAPYGDRLLGTSPLDADELASGLKALQASGLLRVEDDTVVLGETAERLLDDLMMLKGHLLLRAARTREDGVSDLVEVHGLRGSSGSFVMWSVFEGVVTIHPVSALLLCELMARFLAGPELIIASTLSSASGSMPGVTPPASPTSSAHFCHSCGAEFTGDAQFCARCGAHRT